MINLPLTFQEAKAVKSALMTRALLAQRSIDRAPETWWKYLAVKIEERDEALNLFKLTHQFIEAEAKELGICEDCLGDPVSDCPVCHGWEPGDPVTVTEDDEKREELHKRMETSHNGTGHGSDGEGR